MAARSSSLLNNTLTGISRDIGSQYDNVKLVADNIDGVTAVADGINSVNALGPHTQQILTVAGNITDVLTVSENITEITNVTTYMPEINLVGSNIDDVVAVGSQVVPNLAEILLADDNAAIATTKAGEASASATNAAASALGASNSEAAALISEQNASVSETNAAGSAVAALASENASAISAANASNSEVNALASETAAATSEANALASAQSAATSEANAGVSATNALSSEQNAALSETNASNSASTAASHLAAIEVIYDNFDDRYLGAFATDPTLDNDGNALLVGAMYFNTTVNNTKFYNGASWEDPELTATQAASTATTKANEAAVSATNAATSESNASTSEANALASEQAAAASEINAGNSESAAATSAANALTSESNASVSASNASTSEVNAAASEANASASKLAAQTAQGIAETARDQAVASADFVDNLFLGTKTADPSVDNDGNPIQIGAMYYNTALTPSQLKIYDGSAWQQAVFDATGAVLTFNGRDGAVALTNADVTSAVGQVLDTTGTPQFASVQLTGGTGTQGTVSWNSDEETLNLTQNGATLQLGQELQVHCRNSTGSTITNGTVVMTAGTLGTSGRILVAPYDNTSDIKYVIGITTEDIVDGDDGKVTTFGKVRGVNTQAWSEGTVLYTAANGGLTDVVPTTGIKSAIAFVINSASNGTLMVRVHPENELVDYNDLLNAPTNVSTFINDANYLTSYTETDPVFVASEAYNITAQNITDLGNLSGVNTGDQDLSGYATTASLATVATSLALKADQTALDTTNANVTANTNAIAAKADQATTYTKTEVDTVLASKSDTTHNHDAEYEPKNATILKEADIGTKVLAPDGDASQLTNLPSSGFKPLFEKSLFGGL